MPLNEIVNLVALIAVPIITGLFGLSIARQQKANSDMAKHNATRAKESMLQLRFHAANNKLNIVIAEGLPAGMPDANYNGLLNAAIAASQRVQADYDRFVADMAAEGIRE
jgi:hypothetical protein